MLTTSKIRQKMQPIAATVLITLLIWIGSKAWYGDWFDNLFKYPAKIASLSATVMMCWCILLSARNRTLEKYFGGLDKVYQIHKRLGKWSFYTILAHPVFLGLDQMPDIIAFLQSLWFQLPLTDEKTAGANLGVLVLLSMLVPLVPTLWIKIPYHIWKRIHEWFGVIFMLAAVHIFMVDADIARYPLLCIWMYTLILLALGSYVYIRFLYRYLGPCYQYTVSHIDRHKDVLEITFAPAAKHMMFKPSQFVYLEVIKDGITRERHPYSIASGYNHEDCFKLGIKQCGDHTRSLDRLEAGDPVLVYGPYGHFSDRFLKGDRDCVFIGGGIGITPFLGMWHVALHSGEYPADETVCRPVGFHPEICQGWQSPKVAMFYLVATKDQASFVNDIKNEVILSHFHGFKAFEERGFHYELYVDSKQGRMTADYINRAVKGGILDRYIFLCGPTPMVMSLIKQFKEMGIRDEQIVVEDFNLL
jgi:predicted ferric reductase